MIPLPGYHVHEQIYRGKRTLIYRGRAEQDGTPVVIKCPREEYPTPEVLTRLRREYEFIQNFDTEHIVKVHGLRKFGNGQVLILEDFGGESLDHIIASQPLNIQTFLDVALQMSDALDTLFEAGVIHKDINPRNIVYNQQTGQAKLIDFGISTRLSRENALLVDANRLEGTLSYISPEQTGRMNRSIDYRTDFYSLGATFYELLTGKLPFNTHDPLELIHYHMARLPAPPHTHNATIPEPLSHIVMKLLAKTAEERYQSAQGLRADLEICLDETSNKHFVPGRQDVARKFQIPQQLYGREHQTETLVSTFDRICTGATEMVLVSGQSGIGKSALVHQIHLPIVQKRGYFVSGKFDQLNRNIPYDSLIQAFQELVRQLLTESEDRLEMWRKNLLRALGVNGQIIADVIPEIEAVIGKQPPVSELGSAELQNRFNLVFRNFIGVFTQQTHPLVIFFDDLQWADSASLNLIRLLMTDPESRHLLLIGAYRENEQTNALRTTLEEIRQTAKGVHDIALNALELSDVVRIAADTLHATQEKVTPLSELIYEKTSGNPFFVRQFLTTLHQENQLTFKTGIWHWDLEAIRQMDITDNVVEFMATKLSNLPASIQNTLKIAASIGNRFDLDTLCLVSDQTRTEVIQQLWNALQEGLILPQDEAYKHLDGYVESQNGTELNAAFKFAHDRIQQAAYSLIPESQRPDIHLKIGRCMLAHEAEHEERIFDLVNQLNAGIEKLTNPEEQNRLAQLNLTAGKKAKASSAFGPAQTYFTAGANLLPKTSWETHYDLTRTLLMEQSECAYLAGQFEEAEPIFATILNHAQTALDKMEVYHIQVALYTTMGNLNEALNVGRVGLKQAGITFPEKASKIAIATELLKTQWLLRNKNVEDLQSLPVMAEPLPTTALNLMGNLLYSVFHQGQELHLLLNLKMINLTLRYGNASNSAGCYQVYGAVQREVFGNYQKAYRLNQIALEISENSNNTLHYGRTLYHMGAVFQHWVHHARSCIDFLIRGRQYSIESGDFLYTAYADVTLTITRLALGISLDEVEDKATEALLFAHQIKFTDMAHFHIIAQCVVRNLKGLTTSTDSFDHTDFDEAQYVSELSQAFAGSRVWYAIAKLQVLYLY